MIDPVVVGRRVAARRARLKKSVERVAYEAGLSIGAVRSLERGERSATLRVLGAVARALGADPAEWVRK